MRSFQTSCLAAAILLATLTATAHAADKPSDAQIAHVAYTAGDLDIKAAKVALEKSKTPDVRGFADNMVKDHTAVNDKALALVKKLGVTPEDNDTSKSLVKQEGEKQAELAKLSGSAFDKAYIDNEVAYHKTVIAALEKTLIPSSQNAELKSLLQTGVKIFKGHEQHAEEIAAGLK
jgi:putative membrane protein